MPIDPEEAQKQRIKAILDAFEGEPDDRWELHLKRNLDFPLRIEVFDGFSYDYGPVQIGDKFEVTGFCLVDDKQYGEIVKVKSAKGRFDLPLGDLRPLDKTCAAHQLLEDYALWLAEFRDLEPEYW